MARIKKRSEIDRKYRWATEDLYENDNEWQEDFDKALELIDEISNFSGKLGFTADNLLKYLKLKDVLSVKWNKISSYAQRKFDEDTKNSIYQNLEGKIKYLSVKITAALAFETPELLSIDDKKLEEFYEREEELLVYKIYIDNIKRKKDHILTEKEEKILASAQSMATSPSTIMSMFRNADIYYPDIIDENGELQKLTAGTYIKFMESQKRDVRKNAFTNIYKTLDKYKNTVAASYFAHVKQQMFYAKSRNYTSSLEKSLDESNVPVEVYKNLIDTVHSNMHYMHKYVKLRKKLLNLDEIHMYDLYVSIVKGSNKEINFEEAKDEVYEALAPLGEDYRTILKNGFDNRWIDVYENEGKRSGAYSAGSYIHPYVLLNFSNNLSSEFTLAHEMGHAIHSYLSNKTQPVPYTRYRTFVAEVASTFNESLLIEHLLSKATDKIERAKLINHFLEQFRSKVYRQTMFAEFEYLTHKMAEEGQTLTADALNDVYYKLNEQYFGNDIVIDKEISVEWARIPHFFYDFYVYQYATGYSAAIALSRKVLKEGDKAVKKYLKFLGGGCSLTPIELLEVAGVNMASPEPINDALALFGSLVDELEQLLS